MRLRIGPILLFAIIAAGFVAGCGGGGGGSPVPNAGGAGSTNTQRAAASVVVLIPKAQATANSARVHSAYIPANTQSIGIVVSSGSTTLAQQTFNIATPTPCSSSASGYTCTFTVNAIPGNDSLTIKAYSGSGGSGTLLSSGTVNLTIVVGQTPAPVSVSLGGVISSLALQVTQSSTANPYVPIGSTATLAVVAKDGSGNTIVGTYDNPISLSVPSGSGIQVSATSVPDSTTVVSIGYSGSAPYPNPPVNPITITASGDGQTASATFYPTSSVVTVPVPGFTMPPNMSVFGGQLESDGNGNFYYTLGAYSLATPTTQIGVLGEFNSSTGASMVHNLAPSIPTGGVFVDSVQHDLWFGVYPSGGLQCTTAIGGTPSTIPLPSPAATPAVSGFTQDKQNDLWLTDDANGMIEYGAITGPCSLGTTTAITFPTPPPSNASFYFYPGPMIGDPNTLRVWISDQNTQDADFFGVTPGATPVMSPVPLPIPSANVIGFGYDGTGNIDALINNDGVGSGLIGFIPPNGTGLSSTTVSLPNISGNHVYGVQMGNYVSASVAQLGGALTGLGGGEVPLLDAKVSTFNANDAQLLPLPQVNGADVYPIGFGYDQQGLPWAFSSDGASFYFQRITLTSTWNLFVNPAFFYVGNAAAVVGIGGGPSTLSFTVSCSGAITCTQATGYPRIIVANCTAAGNATISVTDNATPARTVTTSVTVASVAPTPGPLLKAPVSRMFRRR